MTAHGTHIVVSATKDTTTVLFECCPRVQFTCNLKVESSSNAWEEGPIERRANFLSASKPTTFVAFEMSTECLHLFCKTCISTETIHIIDFPWDLKIPIGRIYLD
jgi:hypothetical protein